MCLQLVLFYFFADTGHHLGHIRQVVYRCVRREHRFTHLVQMVEVGRRAVPTGIAVARLVDGAEHPFPLAGLEVYATMGLGNESTMPRNARRVATVEGIHALRRGGLNAYRVRDA